MPSSWPLSNGTNVFCSHRNTNTDRGANTDATPNINAISNSHSHTVGNSNANANVHIITNFDSNQSRCVSCCSRWTPCKCYPCTAVLPY